MSISAWRIATDSTEYTADDLTGEGARASGGRWNRAGTPMLYTSGSIALAYLETVVHLGARDLPLNRYLVEIELRDALWSGAVRFDTRQQVGWDALPEGKVSLDAGTMWAASLASALMIVPSVIVPEEANILINPFHPDAARLRPRKVRRWTYDARLRG